MDFNHIDGFIFDLDGTIYLGEKTLPGATELIKALREQNKKTIFVTNKPLKPRQEYAEKLTRLGIPTPVENVITSAYVLGYHLRKTYPSLNYYVIGEQSLKEELRGYGLHILDELFDQDDQNVIDPLNIDAIIVAFDRTINYRKINTAYQALIKGAHFFATNPDKACPMPGGAIPDAGGTIAALEYMTGKKLELLAGKPSKIMMDVAMQVMDLPPSRCLMVGDRLETDIKMGHESGMATAVVLTGTATRIQAKQANPHPDLILENVGELLEYILSPRKK